MLGSDCGKLGVLSVRQRLGLSAAGGVPPPLLLLLLLPPVEEELPAATRTFLGLQTGEL